MSAGISKGHRVSFDDALAIVRHMARPLPSVEMPLQPAHGAVLAQDVVALADYPRFDMSAMDGFALSSQSTETASDAAPLLIPINGQSVAGRAPVGPLGDGWTITTGAPIPPGCDTVLPRERATIADLAGLLHLRLTSPLPVDANIRRRAEDAAAGETVARSGQRVRAEMIGALRCCGVTQVRVAEMPKVTVFSTGDELIGLDGSIIDEGVHDSNSSMIVAQVREAGAQATLASQLPDDAASIANAIRAMSAKRSHIIISTGGVSVGERDYVPAALKACGATIHFHGVYMRPGKPVLFASLPDGTLFFGLPGNPVAAFLGFRFFAYAALRSMVGLAPEVGLEIELEAPRHAEVTSFLRVRSTFSSCGPRVELLSEQQSHRMGPLLAANAWLAMPPQRDLSRKPIIYPLSCLGVR